MERSRATVVEENILVDEIVNPDSIQSHNADELINAEDDYFTRKQVYYNRLCTLIIGEGTQHVKQYVKGSLGTHAPKLEDLLADTCIHSVFCKLKTKRKISAHQYFTLYPKEGGVLKEKIFDITLWVIIARNLSRDRHLIDWDKKPEPDDDLLPHHILRIRDTRNNLSHLGETNLSLEEFNKFWMNIEESLRKLGSTQDDLTRLLTEDLDPDVTNRCVMEVKHQAVVERCTKLELDAVLRSFVMKWCSASAIILFLLMTVAIILVVTLNKAPESCADKREIKQTKWASFYMIPHSGWGARDPIKSKLRPFHGPADYLIVAHTGFAASCKKPDECCLDVKAAQIKNIDIDDQGDVYYNYLIGGDGTVYEGRGTNYLPRTAQRWGENRLSIAIIGEFTDNIPTHEAVGSARILIQYLVNEGYLSNHTTVLAHCQVVPDITSPGINLIRMMNSWIGKGWTWRNWNVTNCLGWTAEDNIRIQR